MLRRMKNSAALIAACAVTMTGAIAYSQDGSSTADETKWLAADQYWDPAAMANARRAVQEEHGASTTYFVQGDRLEYRTNEGDPVLLWDAQGWWGGDRNKLWLKSEGEYAFDEDIFEEAEIQALWSSAITRYFNLQAGVRHDFAPGDDRTFGVLGVQGLAPYWFEIDAAMFVSDNGDVSARVEAEYELLLTQRLILQPRTELNFAIQDVPEYDVGSGLTTAELGARLRYELKREFAPYIGVDWTRSVGDTTDFVRVNGHDPSSLSFVAGIRLWL
ncbi:MAG: copper resistance protein B [Parvularculaceae bacterium]|nr:copper resistance protein B [Parvularculaceae bacterium]